MAKNGRKSTPSFILELPLKTTPSVERAIETKFETMRKVNNTLVAEAQTRIRILKRTKAWSQGRELSKAPPGETKKQEEARLEKRSECFKRASEVLHDHYPTSIPKGPNKEREKIRRKVGGKDPLASMTPQFSYAPNIAMHLDSQVIKARARKIGLAMNLHLFTAGKNKPGKPLFKTQVGSISSIEAGNNKQGILWRGEDKSVEPETAGDGFQVVWKAGRGYSERQLIIEAIIDHKDSHIAHGLQHRVKYCRVLRRRIRGKDRYFVQLVLEGHALQERRGEGEILQRTLGEGVVGIDLGVQTVALVSSAGKATLQKFCATLDRMEKEKARLQRKLDRQRRASNPFYFHENGTPLGKQEHRVVFRRRLAEYQEDPSNPRPQWWEYSKGYLETKTKLAELQRRQAATRKTLHGALVNQVISWGDEFKIESNRVSAWVKRRKNTKKPGTTRKGFGKSVHHAAPASWVSLLERRIKELGGSLTKIATTTHTALSQNCHCGHREKKSLSNRVHNCPNCGAVAQRDLYSAFLCMYAEEDKLTDQAKSEAQRDWERFGPLLAEAWEENMKEASKLSTSLG